jgi:hypothetical protein
MGSIVIIDLEMIAYLIIILKCPIDYNVTFRQMENGRLKKKEKAKRRHNL